jgi:hypothetical protein
MGEKSSTRASCRGPAAAGRSGASGTTPHASSTQVPPEFPSKKRCICAQNARPRLSIRGHRQAAGGAGAPHQPLAGAGEAAADERAGGNASRGKSDFLDPHGVTFLFKRVSSTHHPSTHPSMHPQPRGGGTSARTASSFLARRSRRSERRAACPAASISSRFWCATCGDARGGGGGERVTRGGGACCERRGGVSPRCSVGDVCFSQHSGGFVIEVL